MSLPVHDTLPDALSAVTADEVHAFFNSFCGNVELADGLRLKPRPYLGQVQYH